MAYVGAMQPVPHGAERRASSVLGCKCVWYGPVRFEDGEDVADTFSRWPASSSIPLTVILNVATVFNGGTLEECEWLNSSA
jgi:hypothetical protein